MKSPVVIMRTVRTTQGSSNLGPIMYSSAFRRQDYISTVLLTQLILVLLSNSFVTMSGLEISLAWLHSKTVPTQINLGTGSERTSSLTCLSSRPPKIIHAKLLQVISCWIDHLLEKVSVVLRLLEDGSVKLQHLFTRTGMYASPNSTRKETKS